MNSLEETYPWGKMEWLSGSEIGNASSISVARMFVLPGAQSESHRHSNCEEAIVVVKGEVEVQRDAQSSRHSSGECVVVPAGAAHRLRNIGETEAEVMLMYGAGKRKYEKC